MSIAYKAGLFVASIGRHTAKMTAGITTDFARGMAKGAQGAPEVLPIDEENVDEQLKQEFANDDYHQPELPGMDVPQPEKANV
jgi:hypothetical protein